MPHRLREEEAAMQVTTGDADERERELERVVGVVDG